MYASSTAAKIYEQILFKDNNLLLFTVESGSECGEIFSAVQLHSVTVNLRVVFQTLNHLVHKCMQVCRQKAFYSATVLYYFGSCVLKSSLSMLCPLGP